MADLEGLALALISGKQDEVRVKVQEAVDEGIAPGVILSDGLVGGMSVVGERFRKNLVYVPEVLIAARAMRAGMAILDPLLSAAGAEPVGKVVLGTVKGDLHAIGKNLVAMLLQGGGYEVIDLGTDVSADQFVASARDTGAKVIGLSALLTTTMPYMKEVVDAVRGAGLDGVKTMIGGAPVTRQFADEIGAEGYAADAASAVEVALQLAGQ